jgi:hypothetical protein
MSISTFASADVTNNHGRGVVPVAMRDESCMGRVIRSSGRGYRRMIGRAAHRAIFPDVDFR